MRETVSLLWHYIRARYGLRFRNRAALEHYQQKRLRAFQKHVLSRSPYYRPYQDKPLTAYPLMDKAKMMANFDVLNTRQLKLAEAVERASQSAAVKDFSKTLGDITVGFSSGTSGARGLFAVSRAERLKWAGVMLAKILPGLLFKKHQIAFFLRADSRLYQTANKRGRVSIHFFDLGAPFEKHLITLQAMQPTQIIAPAQTLRLLAEAQGERKIDIRPKRITSVAEVLDPLDEKIIEDAFKQSVHQIYQCTEGFLGGTCAQGRIHLNEEFVFFEKEWVDKKNGRFVPIVTDFSRTTQPIIRYRLDDVLVLDERACPCGAPTTVISRIEGRMDDVLYGQRKDGELAPLFPDYIRYLILRAADKLNDYNLIQETPTSLSLSVDAAFPEDEWQKLADAIRGTFHTHDCAIPSILRNDFVATSLTEKRRRIVRRFSIVKGH